VQDAGLEVVLGTPTATPPVWLAQERPEVLTLAPDGRRRQAGSRRHTCPTSSAYREESARVVAALAGRYGTSDVVTTWQVDNEPGNHDSTRCWCDECAQAFRGWLAHPLRLGRGAQRGVGDGLLVAGLAVLRGGRAAARDGDRAQPGARSWRTGASPATR
jgi:hypothetical protein